MELREAIRGRRSIRQFLPKPVSKKIIEDLISDALWAPSWGNTQPWEIVAVTGEPLEKFKKQNREALISGNVSHPDIPMPETWIRFLISFLDRIYRIIGIFFRLRRDTLLPKALLFK